MDAGEHAPVFFVLRIQKSRLSYGGERLPHLQAIILFVWLGLGVAIASVIAALRENDIELIFKSAFIYLTLKIIKGLILDGIGEACLLFRGGCYAAIALSKPLRRAP